MARRNFWMRALGLPALLGCVAPLLGCSLINGFDDVVQSRANGGAAGTATAGTAAGGAAAGTGGSATAGTGGTDSAGTGGTDTAGTGGTN